MVNYRLSLPVLMVWLLGAASPAAHPIHTTLTEIVQVSATGPVTITVRGFEDDLATAARAAMPRANLDSAIVWYLQRHMALTDSRGRRISLVVTGVRRTADVAWFSFRTSHPVNLEGGRFINTALTELFDDQVNLVQVTVGGRRRTLLFTPGDKVKPIG